MEGNTCGPFTAFDGTYPDNHFAITPISADDPTLIAFITEGEFQFAWIVNPTDRRRYRTILRILNQDAMESVVNRVSTPAEYQALMKATGRVLSSYLQLGLLPQCTLAGNNSLSLIDGKVKLGNAHEPYFLHMHIWGVGDPDMAYIPGLTLRGPAPNEQFDMRGESLTILGNQSKEKWEQVADMRALGKELGDRCKRLDST